MTLYSLLSREYVTIDTMSRKGFAPLLIIFIVVAVLAIGGGAFYYTKKEVAPPVTVKPPPPPPASSLAPAVPTNTSQSFPFTSKYRSRYTTPITIISPSGGEYWTLGSVHTIKWNVPKYNDGNVEITLINDKGISNSFLNVPGKSGSYDWTVGLFKGALIPGKYEIEVEYISSEGCTNGIPPHCWATGGISNIFTVAP